MESMNRLSVKWFFQALLTVFQWQLKLCLKN